MIKDMLRLMRLTTVLATFLAAFQLSTCTEQDPISKEELLDTDGIHLLLDIMRTVRERNPDFAGWNDKLTAMDMSERGRTLDSLSAGNKNDIELNQMVDHLLSSDAYSLYYNQFRNIQPETHRRMLLHLPFGWLPSPGNVSQSLYEICQNFVTVNAWAGQCIEKIDLNRVQKKAVSWLPSGEYLMPPVHFIMDGNGDAFAREGEVCFDLYSLILRKRPSSSRYSGLDGVSTENIEAVLAHEFHHVYARPYLNHLVEVKGDWKSNWRLKLIRTMASEGLAMHCNPPEGLSRATKEDSAVVAFWFRELAGTLAAMDKDSLSEEDMRSWLSSSFHETARGLLRDYMERTYQGEELDRQVALHITDRPSMIYTLGWWMVSRISRLGADKEAYLCLLQEPESLFERYNTVVADGPDSLKAPA